MLARSDGNTVDIRHGEQHCLALEAAAVPDRLPREAARIRHEPLQGRCVLRRKSQIPRVGNAYFGHLPRSLGDVE